MSNHAKLNNRVDTVTSEVTLTGELKDLVITGKLTMLAVFLYRPEDDALVICRPQKMTWEELDAMLRKFDYPRLSSDSDGS